MAANDRHVARSVGLEGVTPTPPDFVLRVDPAGLAALAERVFADVDDAIDIDHLDMELPSVQEAMLDLQDRMATAVEADFDDIVAHCSRSVEVVAYFLGLLELARWGILRVSQVDRGSPILINYSEAAATERLDALLQGEELT
jgi:segregation and condensation protein A